MAASANSLDPDIDSFWEYSDPAASEARFREALGPATGDRRLEITTQLARTYSLRKDFATAHGLLDEVEKQLGGAGPRPRLRYLLERGRTFNSAGERDKARGHFERAWTLARESGEEGLAVDAAHMVAITHSGTPQALEWNEKGLALARQSKFAKAQALVPAMHNNMAWDLHDLKRYDEALVAFRLALDEWTKRGKPRQIQVAKWSVAQCLRSLKRDDEALVIERALEAEGFKP
jgi:tetratricopeptide (TPR) repeat protein